MFGEKGGCRINNCRRPGKKSTNLGKYMKEIGAAISVEHLQRRILLGTNRILAQKMKSTVDILVHLQREYIETRFTVINIYFHTTVDVQRNRTNIVAD